MLLLASRSPALTCYVLVTIAALVIAGGSLTSLPLLLEGGDILPQYREFYIIIIINL
jgi:hypothetical protein